MRSLGLVTNVMVAGAGLVMTQTPEELCTLAPHNVNLISMAICHQLRELLGNDL